MFNRLNEYLTYRANRRSAKREFARLAAVAMPAIHALTDSLKELAESVQKTTAAAKPESEAAENGTE